MVESVRLTDVRCHATLDVPLGPGVTVLVGPNAAGKTTVLEALHLLLRGWSPRTGSPREVIRTGAAVLRVEAQLRDDLGESLSAALGYDQAGERRLTCAGTPLVDCGRWEELLPTRMFLPDHLQLVKGSPRRRRQYLDGLIAPGNPGYRQAVADYEEALRQRNFLLRMGADGDEHGPWEVILAREGLGVGHARAAALTGFTGLFLDVHARLAAEARDAMELLYRTNVAGLDEEGYRERLAAQRGADRRRTFTHSGPHRDDLRFVLHGRDLRDYGSQGEQRTVLLALLLAEREWLRREQGRDVLLLLDDVMSELDVRRREALLALLERGGGQALITTTTLDYFASEQLAKMQVEHVEGPLGAGRRQGDEP